MTESLAVINTYLTGTVDLTDDKISTLENMEHTWHSQIKIMTFTFYLLLFHTDKLEDHEAPGCRPVSHLATHCLTRSSYVSQLTRKSDKNEIFIIWTMKISMTRHKTTKYEYGYGRAAKNINRPGASS